MDWVTLAPYQLSYNGLTFGANTGIEITSISGLRETPPTRGSDMNRPRRHGAFAGRTLFGERIVTLTLQVWATPTVTFEQQLVKLSTAFANIQEPTGLLPLQFVLSPAWATPRQVYGRVTKGGLPIDVDYSYGRATVPIEITCPDPLIYETATQAPTSGLPSPTAGLTFPRTFDATFGASSGGGLFVANGGNEAIPPVWTFQGPLTWPLLGMGAFSLGFQVTLGASDSLVVDCSANTAILNGTASRAGTIMTGSQYFPIPPGGSSVDFSSVDAVAVAGTVTGHLNTAAWGWC